MKKHLGWIVGKSLRLLFSILLILLFSSGYALSAVTYKVKTGDTLATISKKYQVPVGKLKSLNGLTSNKLKIGQTLVVSSDAGPSAKQKEKTRGPANKNQRNITTAANETQGEFIQYKVEKGDTLESLAEKFDLEKDDILDLNNLKKKRLTPGKLIRLPKPEGENEEIIALAPEMGVSRPLKKWKSEDERGMLVKVAKSFAGAPYRYGGDSVKGLDCSAYVKKIYDIFEVQLPRTAREQYYTGQKVAHNDLATGDLVFFRTRKQFTYPTHVGIYIGEGRFIHASSYCRQGVKISGLSEDYYAKRFVGGVRVKTLQQESSESVNTSPESPIIASK
jgi:peptidoglycan DL-endopeptidase LytE